MTTYIIDREQSKIRWRTPFGEQREGTVEVDGGKLFTEQNHLVDGFINIDLDSIQLYDDRELPKEEADRLTEQLKSKEFLDVDQHPLAEYKIDNLSENANYPQIQGRFRLKNNQFNFNFPVNIEMDEQKLEATSDFIFQSNNEEIKEALDNQNSDLPGIELELSLVAHAEAL